MNGSVVKRTQDTLGRVIRKPPLTDKLLAKPPFRYLHDILSEVIRTTGFMKGLYVENEMKSDNVKEKDSKIAFLQKAIDVVMLVSGETLAVKPARIVAGHEPERTNELLQAIAKCCLSKMSSEDAVKRVLAGEKVDPKSKASSSSSRSQDKENRDGRERQPDREASGLSSSCVLQEKREILERSGSQEHKDPEQPKEPEGRQDTRERQRTRERRGKETRDKEKEPQKEKEKEKDREREKDKERHREKDRGREKDREKDREREKDRDKTKDRDSHRERERDRRREREKERERPKEGDERGKALEKGDRKVRHRTTVCYNTPELSPTPTMGLARVPPEYHGPLLPKVRDSGQRSEVKMNLTVKEVSVLFSLMSVNGNVATVLVL
ncbi:TRAF3-interacting protein 1 [Merluccius polli]|uniref:TRAF3-interacting protein 1 n=1 Tax=Merluccius polli TaxID=89951 RepID=A0AA47MI11_MERPO|nr:TRAF3-interacting protein 1 [Merluccius polli]